MNKLQKIVTVGTLGLAGILAGCERQESKEVIKSQTPVYETSEQFYYSKAMDGSTVLVINQPTGAFVFYRDRDNDGFADSKGRGVYWQEIPKIYEEVSLPGNYEMEDLKSREIMPIDFGF